MKKQMKVDVYKGRIKTSHSGISAVGIGHDKKDLVLVPAILNGEKVKPLEIRPDDWTRLVVKR